MKRSATILISAASGFVLLAAGTAAGAAIAGPTAGAPRVGRRQFGYRFNGISCTTDGGAAGTVTASTGSDNRVTLTCGASSTDANCAHSNGLGQTYTDCNDLLGDPSTGTGYSLTMATDAMNAGVPPFPVDRLGMVSTLCSPTFLTGSAVAGIVSVDASGYQVGIWQYSGPNTGHVTIQTIPIPDLGTEGYLCPTSSDPTWN